MARDTDADYTITANGVVSAAFEELNLIANGASPASADAAYGLKKLNLIIKNIMGPENRLYRGMKVWQRASAELTLTAKNNFDIYSGSTDLDIIAPIKIITAILRDSNDDDVVLQQILREEYDALPEKSAEGDPRKFLYEQEYEYGTLYFDVIPNDLTKTVVLTYLRKLFDNDAGTEDLDFPQQWHLPLVYHLARDMAPRYGIDPSPYAALLDEARENANTFYPEISRAYFQPEKDW